MRDTNVLVSGMINPMGAPGRIVDLMREGELELTVDDRILAEYTAVLKRRKFRAYPGLSGNDADADAPFSWSWSATDTSRS